MSEVTQSTPAGVRAAAEALKSAIDRHLSAVEARTGEDDADVFAAFEALQVTAEHYDDLLYDVYDEVTPFEFTESVEEPGAEIEAVSVRIRRDYLIEDSEALIAAGQEALLAERPDLVEEEAGVTVASVEAAVAALFDAYDPDALDEHAEQVGLVPMGGTLWVVASAPEEDDTWLDDPFAGTGERHIVYRLDVTVQESEDADLT